MLYKIKYRNGPISNLVGGYRSRLDKYQIIINGQLLEFKSRTSWSGLGTAKRILRMALKRSLNHSYGWTILSRNMESTDEIVTDIIKKHAGKDPLCRIHLRKI